MAKQKFLFNKNELRRQTGQWAKANWGEPGGETVRCAVIDPVGSGLPGGRVVGTATRKRRLPAAE